MKADDKIKCIGPIRGCNGLTLGKIYDVWAVCPTYGHLYILNDDGRRAWYSVELFKVFDDNTLQKQIDKAISMIGKCVKYGDYYFTPDSWGVGNKYTSNPKMLDNLVDGVFVYVESDEEIAPLCAVSVVDNLIKLTNKYNAIIDGDVVKVGCENIPIEKVEQILELYKKLNK
jgi:hypothetical protein